MIQHQFVFVRHAGRQQAYFGSTTVINKHYMGNRLFSQEIPQGIQVYIHIKSFFGFRDLVRSFFLSRSSMRFAELEFSVE